MKRTLWLLIAAGALLTSCNLFNNHGKKVRINDKSTVYFKGEGVTEAEAKKLGEYLSKNGVFDGKEDKAVQILKEGDNFVVRIPVKQDVINKDREKYETQFWFWQELLSENVFDGKKTKVILTDDQFKDVTILDDLNKVAVGKDHFVFLKGNTVKENDARKIGDSLETAKFFDYTAGAVLLTKERGEFTVRFLANEQMKAAKGEDYNSILENYSYIISKYILDGNDVSLYLIDDEFNILKKIKEPNDQRKAMLDQLINGQTEQNNPYNQTQYTQEQQQQTQTATDDHIEGGSY
jgi:hypothetical protein